MGDVTIRHKPPTFQYSVSAPNTAALSGKLILDVGSLLSLLTNPPTEYAYEPPHLARSALVREPLTMNRPAAALGDFTQKQGQIDQPERQKASRGAKRRGVQVEYVAPQSSATRGDKRASTIAAAAAAAEAKTRVRSESQCHVEVSGKDG
jgi:hypothetical protein